MSWGRARAKVGTGRLVGHQLDTAEEGGGEGNYLLQRPLLGATFRGDFSGAPSFDLGVTLESKRLAPYTWSFHQIPSTWPEGCALCLS